ncbi:hypothetical protein [Thermoactinomyces sp. DSM 45892]|uniref:hypothetical protein n=1 Tax=Thermoactinomyces sp. DSM 45892 TaxID=1882753 RepID=UPI00089BD51B|nr:hypothetical protein [Thermoactinomyces sp. DSM 45892]SDY05236.1 hypothetical protein SAMN05444416_101342 [Thermoactinomyces sp. DSM 45892]
MKLKRGICATFLTFIVILTTPFTVLAGSGEWDYVGGDAFSYSSRVFYSGGGDFKFCLRTGSPTGRYVLFEDDAGGADDYVGEKTLKAGECAVFRNLNRFKDGDNHKAEFKVIKNINTTKWAGVDAWD